MTLDDTRHVFQKWLHLPDTGSLDAVLATVVANRLDGDPVWLLLVGPPGGGKSEVLNAIVGLEDAHPAGTLTEASLLSGTPKRDEAKGAKGGLLRSIDRYGIIVAKDFGSVLSMNRDSRAQLLAALREVYDGSWTRHVGSDGGRQLHWEGKVGFVGGCTPTIDRHHAVMGAMGERFVLYRLHDLDNEKQAREALGHFGKERQMRKELAGAAHTLLASIEPRAARKLTGDDTERLVTLATLVSRTRSAVERDSYSREIELVPDAEVPTRLIKMLARLIEAITLLGGSTDEAWQLVTRIALDSMPALRLAVLAVLFDYGKLDTTQIGIHVRHPTTTTRRALEDLNAHGLVDVEHQGEGKPHQWWLTAWTLERLTSITSVPEMSSYIRTRNIREVDTSGKPPMEESDVAAQNGANPAQTELVPVPDAHDEDIPW